MKMNRGWLLMASVAGALGLAHAAGAQKAPMSELAPTGKIRVGVAVGPTPGAGNVARDAATGGFRGIAIELGTELGLRLRIPVEFVPFPNSGALTDAAAKDAWDVAFIPVDDERRKLVDFGAAHLILQSTYLVGPGSPIRTLADVDKPGVRVTGVENTATARAAARSLKNVTIALVKTADELLALLIAGKTDAIAQSRESLTEMSAKLPGSRVLDGAYLNSFVAVAVPKKRPAALAYVTNFIEEAKAAGSVRAALDKMGMKSSVVAPPGVVP
jgi:polar amino acid transport system substrate-binding protein